MTQPPPGSIILDGETSAPHLELGALSNQIASTDSELTVASAVFHKSEAEHVDLVDTLQRATSIIHKETAKKTAFLRKKVDAPDMTTSWHLALLWSMRQLSSFDKQELVALMQSQQSSDDDDGEFSLAAATHSSRSSHTDEVPMDSLGKSQSEFDQSRHAASNAAHSAARDLDHEVRLGSCEDPVAKRKSLNHGRHQFVARRRFCLGRATVLTTMKRQRIPLRSRSISKSMLRSTLQNLTEPPPELSYWTARFWHFSRSLVLSPQRSSTWTPRVFKDISTRTGRTLSRASRKCRRHLTHRETFRNFIRPAVCCTRGRLGFKRRMIGVIEIHFSIKLAELQVQKFEARHQKMMQEDKFGEVSSVAHRVALRSYAQGRTLSLHR